LKIPTQRKKQIYYPTLSKAKRTTPTLVLERKAPNQFTEATLLRAMETAGKQVDDEDLRELMKENGIDVRQHERILLKRYLNVNTSLEIKTGVNGDWYSVDWYHSK
jgi:trimethylamine:corrinoid methyltransferase-like protein